MTSNSPTHFVRAFHVLTFLAILTCTIGNRSFALGNDGDDDNSKPNIVMILSDDQAWNDYSFMGHKVIQTPNLDELAKRSVLFRRGYVPTALCRPSLMTLITGLYAHQHGVTGNDPSPKYAKQGSQLNRDRRAQLISKIDRLKTLPNHLVDQGYVCFQSGKWWEGNFKRGGFTAGMTRGFPEPGGRHGDDGLKIGREGMAPVTNFIDDAIEKEKPFFVWYAPFLPHTPHNPPPRLLDKYTARGDSLPVAKYQAMCEWFDETCGQLIDHLTTSGVRDNTVIVFVSDNGWIQSPDSNQYAPRSKQTPYEGGVRTPILFSWPDQFEPADRPELVSSIDIVPTLLSIAGVEPDSELPGLNLLESLKTGRPIDRPGIFGESFAHDIADLDNYEATLLFRWYIEGKWKLILTYDGEVNRSAKTHPRTERRPQLFDIIADPTETKNLAAQNPKIVAAMVDKIEKWYTVKERKALTTFE